MLKHFLSARFTLVIVSLNRLTRQINYVISCRFVMSVSKVLKLEIFDLYELLKLEIFDSYKFDTFFSKMHLTSVQNFAEIFETSPYRETSDTVCIKIFFQCFRRKLQIWQAKKQAYEGILSIFVSFVHSHLELNDIHAASKVDVKCNQPYLFLFYVKDSSGFSVEIFSMIL